MNDALIIFMFGAIPAMLAIVGSLDRGRQSHEQRLAEDADAQLRYITGLELSTGIIDEAQALDILGDLKNENARPVVEQTSVWHEWEERNRAELNVLRKKDRTPFNRPDMDVIAR